MSPSPFVRVSGGHYIRAVQMREGVDVKNIAARYPNAQALLLDTYSTKARGGTGTRFDWGLWPNELNLPLILAGGLNPENVAMAIQELQPNGVDVSGGVEVEKGVKSPELIKRFVEEVKNVR